MEPLGEVEFEFEEIPLATSTPLPTPPPSPSTKGPTVGVHPYAPPKVTIKTLLWPGPKVALPAPVQNGHHVRHT